MLVADRDDEAVIAFAGKLRAQRRKAGFMGVHQHGASLLEDSPAYLAGEWVFCTQACGALPGTINASDEQFQPERAAAPIAAPVAAKKPASITHHGITVTDDYAWLRDAGYPQVTDKAVLAHLEAENAWFEARMAPRKALVDDLFKEMRARIKEADRSVPQKDGDYLYWIEFEEGAEYKKWWRKPVAGGEDELILDEVALAAGHDYFRLGALSVSNDGKMLAWSVDDNGSERFTARIKVIATGEELPDVIEGTLSSLVWVAEDKGLVYSLANENWRTDNARLHWLGQPLESDVELYHEDDEGFRVGSSLSANEKWLVIGTSDHETSETYLIPANDPLATPLLVKARQEGVEYDADERDGVLYIHANDTHENFRIATAPLSTPASGRRCWKARTISMSPALNSTAISCGGEPGARPRYHRAALLRRSQRIEPITFPEASYDAGLADNPEWAVDKLRLTYESMVSPATVYDYHLADKSLEVLKVQQIPSGYDASLYETQRLEIPRATARWCPSASSTARTARPAIRCTSMAMAPMAWR
jgi:oligopeptidase B